jgi:hypothetical protein
MRSTCEPSSSAYGYRLASAVDIAAMFKTMKYTIGLNAARITAVIAKLMRIASETWRNEARRPISWASIPFSTALPAAVRSRMSGNFSATYAPMSGDRHEPIATP